MSMRGPASKPLTCLLLVAMAAVFGDPSSFAGNYKSTAMGGRAACHELMPGSYLFHPLSSSNSSSSNSSSSNSSAPQPASPRPVSYACCGTGHNAALLSAPFAVSIPSVRIAAEPVLALTAGFKPAENSPTDLSADPPGLTPLRV